MGDIPVEDIVMELVANGGDARSKALEAIEAAKEGNFDEAEKCLEESQASLTKAHNFQTSIIQEIGQACGYDSPSYFGKVFRKVCGVSPKEYRTRMFQ